MTMTCFTDFLRGDSDSTAPVPFFKFENGRKKLSSEKKKGSVLR